METYLDSYENDSGVKLEVMNGSEHWWYVTHFIKSIQFLYASMKNDQVIINSESYKLFIRELT